MSDPVVAPANVMAEPGQDVPVDVGAIVAKYQAQLTATPVAEASQMPSAETVPTGGTPSSSAVAEAAAKVAETPAPTPETKPEEPTLRSKQILAMARLEEEARRTKELYEAKLRELETKPKETPAVSSLDELRELFEIDPDAALAALQIQDKSSIAARLMYGALGEDAPADLKKEMADRRRDAELAALRRKVEQRDKDGQDVQQKAVFAARVEATDRELTSFVQSVPAEMRFLAAAARENPAEVLQGLYQVAGTHIQAGRFPAAREVAQAIEDQLAADYARLSRAVSGQAASPPASQPAPAQSPPRTLETLSDADTRGRPGLGDQPTPEQLADPEYWIERGKAKLRALGIT